MNQIYKTKQEIINDINILSKVKCLIDEIPFFNELELSNNEKLIIRTETVSRCRQNISALVKLNKRIIRANTSDSYQRDNYVVIEI